jgi:Secretion system C-terminal sorting domain
MKKILLLMSFFALVLTSKSQTVLNEVYTEPGANNEEFFELYNSALGAQSVDCFTILIYYKNSATDRGWYVLDLPADNVVSKGYYVGSSANPFTTQNNPLPGVIPNLNWNDINFRNGSTGGYLKKFRLNVSTSGYTDISPANNVAVTDLFSDVAIVGGHNYIQLVYVNGVFSNCFWGGGSSATLPAEITSMSSLPVDMSGQCVDFTANFAAANVVAEFVNQSPGNDNGYARKRDGKCGEWDKTSNALNHTPGVSNGSAGTTGAVITNSPPFITCAANANSSSFVTFDITGGPVDAFPVNVQLYVDNTPIGVLDGNDVAGNSVVNNTAADPFISLPFLPQNKPVLLVLRTPAGCFDKVISVLNSCIVLPVTFSSFTAVRNNSNVLVKWETTSEQNNTGFAIERNINGNWQQVAFVPTQAVSGNSDVKLSYSYIDVNLTRGISQYRIKQIDIDAKTKYTEVRSVRGDGQPGKIIVYPNPSNDGKVNIVFEDVRGTRNISITDMSGRVIKQINGVTNNNIQIEKLLPGMYSLRIMVVENGEQTVEKIIVNK